MIANKEQRKAKAIEIMKQLDIYTDFIKGYEQNDYICMYERYIGFWTFQYPELEAKMKEIENTYGCTVYAVTHSYVWNKTDEICSEFGSISVQSACGGLRRIA